MVCETLREGVGVTSRISGRVIGLRVSRVGNAVTRYCIRVIKRIRKARVRRARRARIGVLGAIYPAYDGMRSKCCRTIVRFETSGERVGDRRFGGTRRVIREALVGRRGDSGLTCYPRVTEPGRNRSCCVNSLGDNEGITRTLGRRFKKMVGRSPELVDRSGSAKGKLCEV